MFSLIFSSCFRFPVWYYNKGMAKDQWTDQRVENSSLSETITEGVSDETISKETDPEEAAAKARSFSAAAAVLGSIRTERKARSSAANATKASQARLRQRRPVREVPCGCGADDSIHLKEHRGFCPRYQAIYYRQKRGLPLD